MMATKMPPVTPRLDLEFRGEEIRTGLGAGGQRQGVDDGHEDAAGARRRARHCRRDQRLRNTQPVGGAKDKHHSILKQALSLQPVWTDLS